VSTYILEEELVSCVVTFAAQHGLIEKEDRQEWSECFWQANYESFNEVWKQDLFVPEFKFLPSFAAPERIMELCEQIAYNSAQSPGWEDSDEVHLLRQIYLTGKKLHQAARQLAKETAAANAQRWQTLGLDWIKANQSKCGDFAIIAQLMQDLSDSQTDYSGSTCLQTRLLAWSNHGRNLFAEMRKAAATWPETAHLGKAKGLFKVMVMPDPNEPCRYAQEWAQPKGPNRFATFAAAQTEAQRCAVEDAQNEQKLAAGEIQSFAPNFPFGYEIRGSEDAIEHRENYSMGKGYYLAQESYGGWQVRKVSLQSNLHRIAEALGRQIEAESEQSNIESQPQVQALN
jgi:hypothetical protein